jgi:hypothetical protein
MFRRKNMVPRRPKSLEYDWKDICLLPLVSGAKGKTSQSGSFEIICVMMHAKPDELCIGIVLPFCGGFPIYKSPPGFSVAEIPTFRGLPGIPLAKHQIRRLKNPSWPVGPCLECLEATVVPHSTLGLNCLTMLGVSDDIHGLVKQA